MMRQWETEKRVIFKPTTSFKECVYPSAMWNVRECECERRREVEMVRDAAQTNGY